VKYSDPSGYDPIYSPETDYGSSRPWTSPDGINDISGDAALFGITSIASPIAIVRHVLRAKSYARFVKEGLDLRKKIFLKKGDDEAAAIGWIQGQIRGIEHRERGNLTTEELDHMVQVGRSKGLDFIQEGPHQSYKYDHLHIKTSSGKRADGHIKVPSSYTMP
jgi:hypothetical protein